MARTNIVLDDQFVRRAMRLTRAKTKRQLVDAALRELINLIVTEVLQEVPPGPAVRDGPGYGRPISPPTTLPGHLRGRGGALSPPAVHPPTPR